MRDETVDDLIAIIYLSLCLMSTYILVLFMDKIMIHSIIVSGILHSTVLFISPFSDDLFIMYDSSQSRLVIILEIH